MAEPSIPAVTATPVTLLSGQCDSYETHHACCPTSVGYRRGGRERHKYCCVSHSVGVWSALGCCGVAFTGHPITADPST